MIAVSNM